LPFCKWISGVRWLHCIWIGYSVIIASLTLTVLLVDFWIYYSPDGMTRDIRPILSPIFRKIAFIKNEYDLNDFNMLLRILINSLLSVLFLWLIDKIVKSISNSRQQRV